MATLVSQPEDKAKDQTLDPADHLSVNVGLAADVVGMGTNQLTSARLRPARPRPLAQRIQLAKVNVLDPHEGALGPSSVMGDTGRQIDKTKGIVDEFSAALDRDGKSDKLLVRIIAVVAEQLGLARLLVLKGNSSKAELIVAGGLRDDLEALAKELRITLMPARAPGDVFSQAYHQCRDVVVDDAYGVRASATVPLCYYEKIGAPTFALYSCAFKGVPTALVLVDAESPSNLPSPERLSVIAPLRPIIARAIA